VSAGAEYWYQNQFALRGGYFFEDKTKGNRRYFTAGVGIKYNVFGLNFSYLIPTGSGNNQNPLANTLRFSLVFDLGANAGGTTTTVQ
ncbi:MAG TPA: PorV/PorQ family protein, partial [Flavisolibacter sp.]|nr:PorV/PorQ family protein [Flavisolibacter sp.]